MAVRNDLVVDWEVSPRVITVLAPSVEITIQDLHDSCRFLESEPVAMDDPILIDTAGLENLGGGTKVGLTATLQNALVAFEARTGPQYIQCNVSGGNVVAIDDVGSSFTTPVHPTAFTQVVITASSSATLQSQAQLEYSTFGGGVTYDVLNGEAGINYPIGTPGFPSNNINDANTIADSRGFPSFLVSGDLDITSSTPPLDGHNFIGSGKDRTNINVSSNADVTDCAYYDAHVTGTLDGNSRLSDCVIDNLVYVKGFIEQCVLAPGIIELAGTDEAHFLDCWSGQPGSGTPIIDFNGEGQALAMRNYNGGILLRNKTGTEAVSIDLNSGQVKLEAATIHNAGTLVFRGVGKVIDSVTGEIIPSGNWNGCNLINETVSGITQNEIANMLGLVKDDPITIGNGKYLSNDLDINVTDNGNGTYTLSRQ